MTLLFDTRSPHSLTMNYPGYWPPPFYWPPPPHTAPPPPPSSSVGGDSPNQAGNPPPMAPGVPPAPYPVWPGYSPLVASLPPALAVRDAAWKVATHEQPRFASIVHLDCDHCSSHAHHIDSHIAGEPVPPHTLRDIISHLQSLLPSDSHPLESASRAPTPEPRAKRTLIDRFNMTAPSTDEDPIPEVAAPLADIAHMLQLYARSTPLPLPLYRFSSLIQYTWVPEPLDWGFNPSPSPIFAQVNSRFQSVSDFFKLEESDLATLSPEDRLRFGRASINTHVRTRTPLMEWHSSERVHLLRKKSRNQRKFVVTPPGLPEEHWPLMDMWIQNPGGIPHTIRVSGPEQDELIPWDVYIHLWVTRVTWGRRKFLVDALLLLFSRRGAALGFLWNNILLPNGRVSPPTHPFLTWPFAVSTETSYRVDCPVVDRTFLTSYLSWLVDCAYLPIYDSVSLQYLFNWADRVLSGYDYNNFSTGSSQLDDNRRATIDDLHEGQAWVRPDDNYPHCPDIEHHYPLNR